MFNFKLWLKESYINLVLNGTWSRDYCAVMCDGQLSKGRFSEVDVEDIYYAAEPKPEPEPEIPPEEIIEEPESNPEEITENPEEPPIE